MARLAILGSRGYPSHYGGFETLVRRLAPWLEQRGHDVTVYGRYGPTATKVDGITTRKTWGTDRKSLSTLSFGATALLDARRRAYDALLVLNPAHGPLLPLLRSDMPVAVNVDGLEWERQKWSRSARRYLLWAAHKTANHASTIVCDSRALGDIWRTQFDRKHVFIPYGGDLLDRQAVDADFLWQRFGVKPGTYALIVARLVPENNVDLILTAIQATGIPTLVVGSDHYAARGKIPAVPDMHHVSWLGHISDDYALEQLWLGCRLYLHGHSVGGTNPALLQAMGAGAPILALDTVFNREVLGESGWLFPRRAEPLEEKLTRLWGDSGACAALSRAAQQRCHDHYSWDQVCRDYESLLLNLRSKAG